MDMHMIDLERKNKLPAIATAVAVHVLMLGLALHSSPRMQGVAPELGQGRSRQRQCLVATN